MLTSARLRLMRHGEVAEPSRHTFGGRIDMDLSPCGEQQASRLAQYLEPAEFHAWYASLTLVEALPGRPRLQRLNFTPWRDLP